MREKDFSEIVVNIMNHPVYVEHFYDHNRKRIIPEVNILPESEGLNAYAGISNGRLTVQATIPLIYLLDSDEFSGVIGHEVCHLKYKDYDQLFRSTGINIVVLAVILIYATLYISALITISAFLIGLIFIRKNYFQRQQALEYRADIYGASVSSPEAMISSLRKLDAFIKKATKTSNDKSKLDKILSHFETHPSVEDRIANIRAWAEQD